MQLFPLPQSPLELFRVILRKPASKTSNKQKRLPTLQQSPPAGSYRGGSRARPGVRTPRTRSCGGKEHTPPQLPAFSLLGVRVRVAASLLLLPPWNRKLHSAAGTRQASREGIITQSPAGIFSWDLLNGTKASALPGLLTYTWTHTRPAGVRMYTAGAFFHSKSQ